MLVLHGSAISNYYNKVKLALLEKGVPFEEAYAATHSSDEAVLSASPLGKIPFVDRKSTRLNSSHIQKSRMPSSA